MILNLLLIFLSSLYYFRVIKNQLSSSFFSILFIYQGFWAICSLAFIEISQIYLSEIDRNGFFVYSVPIFLAFNLSNVYFANKWINKFEKSLICTLPRIFKVNQQLLCLKFVFWIILSLLYINLLISPIPLFDAGEIEGFNSRVNFWSFSKLPFLKVFGEVGALLNVIAGIFLLYSKREGIIMAFIYYLYVILLGHKFGTFVMLSFFLSLPLIIKYQINRVRVKIKYVFIALFVVIIFVAITYTNYSNVNPYRGVENIDTPLLAVLYRAFALQSQLIWVTIEQNIFLSHESTQLPFTDLFYGMHNLMNKYSAGGIDVGRHEGSTLTNGYPSILIETLPLVIALVFNVILTVVFSFWAYMIKISVKKKNYFVYIIAYFIFGQVYNFFSIGNFAKMVPAIVIMLLLLMWGIRLQNNGLTTNKTN